MAIYFDKSSEVSRVSSQTMNICIEMVDGILSASQCQSDRVQRAIK